MAQVNKTGSVASHPSDTSGERAIRITAAVSLAFSLVYIIWRWGWTLNMEALWFSVPFVIAETYGLITAFFMTFTTWRLKRRVPGRAPPGRAVDVFVTTYDEPLTVIRKTLLAAREIRYPHKTYVLDDGKRDEIMTMADELGIGYIRRDTNEHAKAGNLNNALRNTRGEFVLQLDADHVPLPQIIDQMLGFMDDERVGFVQSPQDFYNHDAFTYDVNQRARRIWEDQQLFFRVLQPGKDQFGAAFFVGSCALLRRRALDDVGGFATSTITEDIETSLLLHSRGWTSVFLNETLAYGLAPVSASAFHVQHLRWGQGAMQALRKYRPLSMPGLTLGQRIAYFDSLATYLGGFQRLILYMAPLAFFFTGAFPLRASALEFGLIFVPYITLQIISFKLLARGHGSLLLADRYAMAKFFTHMLAVSGFFTRKPLKFKVTPKGQAANVPFGTYAPQLTLIVVTVIAVAWGVTTHLRGDEYVVPGWGQLAFWVNLLFALWNAAVAGYIVRMCLRIKQKRADYRFAESLPVAIKVFRSDLKKTGREMAVTENLSPFGVSVRSMQQIAMGDRVELELPLSRGPVDIRGRVVHTRIEETSYGKVFIYGIEFTDMEIATRDTIELHCAHHAAPLDRQRYEESAGTFAETFRRWRYGRGERRVAVGMPARVLVGSNGNLREIGYGLLEDVSVTGARIMISHPIAPASRIRIEIPNSDVATEGETVFVHTLETSVGLRFIVGIATIPAIKSTRDVEQRLAWLTLVRGLAGRTMRAVWSTRTWLTATWAARAAAKAPPVKPVAVKIQAAKAVAAKRVPSVTWIAEPQEVPQLGPEPTLNEPLLLTTGEDTMDRQAIPLQDYTRSYEAESHGRDNALMTIRGDQARLEGKFVIANSIEVECEISGEMEVGGRLVIGERGNVTADVKTVDAVIRGSYSGTLLASGSVEITSTGRVSGSLHTPELIIAKGAAFTGTVERTEAKRPPEVASTPLIAPVQPLNPTQQVVTLAADPAQNFSGRH